MNGTKILTRGLLALLVLPLATATGTPAEDVEKKFRLSVALGGYNPQDEINSSAANTFNLVDSDFETTLFFRDPRDDSAALGSLEVKAGVVGTLAVQYAMTKVFVLEGSVGYGKHDIGDVEISAQPFGQQPVIDEFDFNFSTFRIPAGELERVPIQLSGIMRLRPRARLNPYFGAGLGYVVQGFTTSPELNQLSLNMDRSFGIQTRVTESFNASTGPSASTLATLPGSPQDLTGASIDVRDTFEWHLVAGAEMSIRKQMTMFLDVRWVDASRDVAVTFNGQNGLGIPVPQFTQPDVGVTPVFGAMRITSGGLVDTGRLATVPNPNAPLDTNCVIDFQQCHDEYIPAPGASSDLLNDPCPNGSCPTGVVDDWLTPPVSSGQARYPDTDPGAGDGQLDGGLYYVDGGRFQQDGFSLQVGFRYTF